MRETHKESCQYFQSIITCIDERLENLEVLLYEAVPQLITAISTLHAHLDALPPLSESPDGPLLTQEEAAFLKQLGQGYSLKQLSAACHLSKSTIERHISALCEKCGVANRTQLVVWATRHGYCTLPENAAIKDG